MKIQLHSKQKFHNNILDTIRSEYSLNNGNIWPEYFLVQNTTEFTLHLKWQFPLNLFCFILQRIPRITHQERKSHSAPSTNQELMCRGIPSMQKTMCYRLSYPHRREMCSGDFKDKKAYIQMPEVSVAMTTARRLPVAMFWTKRIFLMDWIQVYIEDNALYEGKKWYFCPSSEQRRFYILFLCENENWSPTFR